MMRRIATLATLGMLWLAAPVQALQAPGKSAISSAHPLATEAGEDIIKAGGNAFDAAIAVSAALAVVEPYSSGIGGGGFFLMHHAIDDRDLFLDARERAPLAADARMFLGEDGKPVPGKSMNGPLAAAIPGLPAALVHLALRYGRLPLERTLAPAIRLAREGFAVTPGYLEKAGFRLSAMAQDPETARLFLDNGALPEPGYLIRQRDLADTLREIARQGTAGFYAGEIADELVTGVRSDGGIWTAEDLLEYRVVEREPLRARYHDMEIVSAPPPSSGGVVLIEALNMLEQHPLPTLTPVARDHLVIEAMRRAYRDRAEFLGDPDFVDVPVTRLIGKAHAETVGTDIDPAHATPSASLKPIAPPTQGPHTTHLSVMDAEGNRVAATLSINYPFGACHVPPGSGVLLNNEMDDFSSAPLTPNAYGLVGVEANAIAPGKRPLSSMTPTFLRRGSRLAVLGTPGGSRIISMVLLGTLEFFDGKPPEDWVSRPRFHHQYLPDEVLYEPLAFDEAARAALTGMGHKLSESTRNYGNMHAILWDLESGEVSAAADPRGEGLAKVWATPLLDPAADGLEEVTPTEPDATPAADEPGEASALEEGLSPLPTPDDALEAEVRFSAPADEPIDATAP
jgi:gamma-glutamyltranspeptidase/glutathione hydrolase